MKSTLATTLIVLVIAGLLKMDASFSPQAQLNAQPPADSNEAPRKKRLIEDIERFMDNYSEREHQPREETLRERRKEILRERQADLEHEEIELRVPQRGRDLDNRERERMHAAHQKQQQQIEQQKHRIEKMHLAANHLEEAGLHDMARQIHKQAKEQETHLRKHLERIMHRDHRQPPFHEIHELLHQLRNEIHELKSEVRELRKIVAERSPQPVQ